MEYLKMDIKLFKRICIVGSGFMGAQIALHCAVKSYNVWLVDISEQELQKSWV